MHRPRKSKTRLSTEEEQLLQQIKVLQMKLRDKKRKRFIGELASGDGYNTLIIVANRLPVSITKANGTYTFRQSSGGLVSALSGVKDINMRWVGWPGLEIPEEDRPFVTKELERLNCVPVFLSQDLISLYYNGFSNNILWPLFHYIPLPIDAINSAQQSWLAYKEANKAFARVVLDISTEDDIVWCHDYHLMLLPSYLRAARPIIKLGWFLHVPFPSSEVFRMLPFRAEILQGVLACNLVGFHIYDYSRHFKSACQHILGSEVTPEGLNSSGRLTNIGAFPIGIDPGKFQHALTTPEVQDHIQEFRRRFAGYRVIVGIDRLDHIKGIPNKLYSMEKFLDQHPEWRGKVTLVQIAVPSRTEVTEYQNLKDEVHQLVGEINGKYGTVHAVPIHFLDQSIPFAQMCALYAISDICLVTSARDGMNLVAYEYVACQAERHGVLILSEFAGASQSLGAGCLQINPWDVNEVADAVNDALLMSPEERREHHSYANSHVQHHTAQHWAESFLWSLRQAWTTTSLNNPIVPPAMDTEEALRLFKSSAGHNIIILGLVGALIKKRDKGMSFERYLEHATLDRDVLNSLNTLSSEKNCTIVVMTSQTRKMVDNLFGDSSVWVVAENGYFVKKGRGSQWECTMENVDLSWMDECERVMEYFCARTPNSVIHRHETFISWHYRHADPSFGERQARDLKMHLTAGPLLNTSTEVISSHKTVQVRLLGVSKAQQLVHLIQSITDGKTPPSYVMISGNFISIDEALYRCIRDSGPTFDSNSDAAVLPEECVKLTATVGKRPTHAQCYIRNVSQLHYLLKRMCQDQVDTPTDDHSEGDSAEE